MQTLNMPSLQDVVEDAGRWCARFASSTVPLAVRFRSEILRPVEFTYRVNLSNDASGQIDEVRLKIVDDLVQKRRLIMSGAGWERCPYDAASGAILAFDVDACYFDGVATSETDGFFDGDDLPPWDTWIAYGRLMNSNRATLLSWVPAEQRGLADRAIAVHMADAYFWLK